MRYVIVSVIKGEAGDFNNNLRKEVYDKFKAKSSKLPVFIGGRLILGYYIESIFSKSKII